MSNPAAVLSRQNPMREETVLYRGWRVCEGLDNSSGTAVGTRRPSEQEGCPNGHQETQVCWTSFNTGSIESSYSRNTGNKARGSTFCDSIKTYKNR